MKKLIAVTASLLFAASAVSVNAADIREAKISVSDIIESVNEKTEGGNSCNLLSELLGCIKNGECTLPELNFDSSSIGSILEGLLGRLPQGNPDTETPDTNIPEQDAPDTNIPDTDIPETEVPDTNIPETDAPDINIPENDDSQNNSGNNNGYQSESEYVNEVLRLVNQYRASNGLGALTLDSSLCNAASIRAQEIKTSFSHTRPDGSSCFTVLSQLGISYGGAGENIAYGQSSPEEVMTAWMNSDGHRANILNSSFTKLGVGVYSSGGTLYWAQMFTY